MTEQGIRELAARERAWLRPFLVAALIAAVCIFAGLSLRADAQGEPTEATTTMALGEDGRWLDTRLAALGVSLVEANAAPGQSYWRIVRVEWQDAVEARNRHHIDIEMLDESGARRLLGERAVVRWQSGTAAVTMEDKPLPEYGGNFPMYVANCSYSVEGLGLPSDRLDCLGLGSIEERWRNVHVVYRVTFQRVAAGAPNATPTAAAPVLGWRIRETAVHPNCGLTRLMGVVQDAAERGLAGHRVEVTWEQPGAATFRTTTNSLGQWEIFLNDRPHSPGPPGWRVTAFDQAGRELTRGHVMTDATNCAPGARNVIELAIEPVPAAATVTPILPLPTPAPTLTPSGYPAPATATPRLSTVPTRTATGTPEPPGLPGGKAIYTGFPDNSTLLYQCSEGEPVAVPVPVGAPIPLGFEMSCVIRGGSEEK